MSLSPFIGRWSITEMDLWDAETIHEFVPAELAFTEDGRGTMRFIVVTCCLAVQSADSSEPTSLSFTWSGDDDGHPCSGSGWVELKTNDRLVGEIEFQGGDVSGFSAVRAGQ